jgi:hypothetical protein
LGAPDLALLPGLGAGTFGALVALHLGWNLNCLFILDGDHKGKAERERYIHDFGIAADRVAIISEFLRDVSVIEHIVDAEAADVIKRELKLASSPTKNQIRRFFQERLAGDNCIMLSAGFESNAALLIEAIEARLHKLARRAG